MNLPAALDAPRRIVGAAVVAGLTLLTLAGCDSGTPETGSTTIQEDAAMATVSYDNRVLNIGDTALTQFPDYKESSMFKVPPGWVADTQIVIEKTPKVFGSPVVAAVGFTEEQQVNTPVVLIDVAESALFPTLPPITAEDTLKGTDRTCQYRVRQGPTDDQGAQRSSGVIIVTPDQGNKLGLHIRGSHNDEVQALTVEIAGQLCGNAPAGA